ncbi:amino acid permease [Spirillospora sp. NPDC047279]|uniref:APC family permease n=1 Tax=Spirillospora sp. NPDC047279 TaxID=3155478 RepID=UPI003401ABDC
MTWDIRMRNDMFRRLPVEQATGQLYGGRHRLRVVYRTRDLIVLGLGVMIGAGIFKIAGQQAVNNAGPAVIISFVVAGVVCLLAALSYAELSSIIPVAGSAYSFSYVAFGELWAWVVGWALVLELLLAASVLARAWSLYLTQALSDFSVPIPEPLAGVIGQERGFDLFALLILVLVVGMLATGSRLGLRTLWYMVMAKLIVLGLVIATGLKFFQPANLTPFVPPAEPAPDSSSQTVMDAIWGGITGGSPQVFGVWGILAATPAIAFGYIGFDMIATASEETEDAPRKVPRGMLTALSITIVLYIGVAIAMVGMLSYKSLDPEKPLLATAFGQVGADSMGKIIDVGVVLGLTTVILVLVISLTRVTFSMARDGLLPRGLSEMSRYRVPSKATVAAGGAAIVMSQTLDVLTLEQMVVVGTLFTFMFVAAGVLALRRDRPDLHRPFKVPAAGLTVLVTILATGWLMLNLQVATWGYFAIWMAIGVVVYLAYGRRKSRLRELLDAEAAGPPPVPAGAPMGSPMNVPIGGPMSAQTNAYIGGPMGGPMGAPPHGAYPASAYPAASPAQSEYPAPSMPPGGYPDGSIPAGMRQTHTPSPAPPAPPAPPVGRSQSTGAFASDPYHFRDRPQEQLPDQRRPDPRRPEERPPEPGQHPTGRFTRGRYSSDRYATDRNDRGRDDPYRDDDNDPPPGGRHRR